MGYNATVVICVDALHALSEDPDFGKKLQTAIMKCSGPDSSQDVMVTDGRATYGNSITVVDNHHADHSALILVGGNSATVAVPYACGYAHDATGGQLQACKAFAEKLGYRLSKKPKKKT